MPAPVIVFCYNRPEHLRKTVEQLKRCNLAGDTTVFFFSDGSRDSNDLHDVIMVREYLHKVRGFKEIMLEFSDENKGLANSVIAGVSKVINQFGTAIVLEDDILVSEDFLEFCNDGLNFYAEDKRIYSISGYSFLLENCTSASPLNLVHRASSWGWATWKDRWNSVNWNPSLEAFFHDSHAINNFRKGGGDLPVMLKKNSINLIDSWAIRWSYHHFVNNSYCLVPKYSKVKNIGTDGSGTNFRSVVHKYSSNLDDNGIVFEKMITENDDVTNFILNKFKPSRIRRLINILKYGIS